MDAQAVQATQTGYEDEAEVLLDSREFTPRLLPLWAIFMDGEPRELKKIMAELGIDRNCLRRQMLDLRKVIRPRGLDVLLRFMDGVIHYQLVRLIRRPARE